MHSIDIGNEGSAFVEVLVGNSSAARDQDFQVLSQRFLTTFYLLSHLAICSNVTSAFCLLVFPF